MLKVDQDDDLIRIIIRDNGVGMDKATIDRIMNFKIEPEKVEKEISITKDSNGIGLGNVINRLKLYYDKDNILSIESEGKYKGTTVTILIPKNKIFIINQVNN